MTAPRSQIVESVDTGHGFHTTPAAAKRHNLLKFLTDPAAPILLPRRQGYGPTLMLLLSSLAVVAGGINEDVCIS